MQYIDFSEDMLYPSEENLIGLPNGFRLSDYDSDALDFTHGHLPPMFGELGEIDVTERFLSLLAVDNTNHIFERVYTRITNGSYFGLASYTRIRWPETFNVSRL